MSEEAPCCTLLLVGRVALGERPSCSHLPATTRVRVCVRVSDYVCVRPVQCLIPLPPPPACHPVQLWHLVRHGSRYPSEKAIQDFVNILPELRARIVNVCKGCGECRGCGE